MNPGCERAAQGLQRQATLTTDVVRHFNIKRPAADLVLHWKCTSCSTAQ